LADFGCAATATVALLCVMRNGRLFIGSAISDRASASGGAGLIGAGGGASYRLDIDGLRAIAVLLVILFHAGFGPVSGGFVGVDIFFVISGYLITGIIARELEAGRFTFANFYARRIKRIFPALFVVLALSAAAAFIVLIPDDLRLFGHMVKSTVFFYSNLFFYWRVNYFDGPAIEKPLLHTWSLAVEEQYYMLWPLIVAGLYRSARRKVLPLVILALFGFSLAASQIVLQFDPSQAFYLLPYRGWELLLGGYLATVSFRPLSRAASSAVGLAGFAAVAYAALIFTTKTPFPGLNALIPCLGAAMLIAAGAQERSLSRAILGLSPMRYVGKISYSLYLIHWPLFSFAYIAYDAEPPAEVRAAIIGVSIVLASLSYWYIETPARRSNLRFFALTRAAVAAAVALGGWGALYAASGGLVWRVPASVQIAQAAKFPGYAEYDRADCRDDPKPKDVHRPCPIGAPARDMQYGFAIWGDSHARHFASAFSDQAKARGLSGIVIWEARCPPLPHVPAITPECKEANASAQQWIATQTKLKMVFLGGFWQQYMVDGQPNSSPGKGAIIENARAGQGAGAVEAGLEDTIRFLQGRGLQVALVETVPSVPVNVPNCASRARMFGRSDARCFSFPRDVIEQGGERASAMLNALSRRLGVPVVETVRAFCERDTCQTEKGGVILYQDANHLNSAGSHYLGTRIDIPWPVTQLSQLDRSAR
jgi:peptidoglycan/LPS O-acetylase OafA/YrhL